MFPPRDAKIISLNWKLRLPAGQFGLFIPLNQRAKKGVTLLIEVIDPDYHGEVGLLRYKAY